MNQPILEIKHLKKILWTKRGPKRYFRLLSIKEKLFLSLEVPVVVNQPSYVQSTYLKHQHEGKNPLSR